MMGDMCRKIEGRSEIREISVYIGNRFFFPPRYFPPRILQLSGTDATTHWGEQRVVAAIRAVG